jgi:hypothetical protein
VVLRFPVVFFNIFHGYYGGGYRVLLPNDEAEAKMALDQLKAYKWVDEGTRALFVTSYMYSNALQALAFVQYVIEFPAAGGAIVSGKIQCMKLSQLYVPLFLANKKIIFCFVFNGTKQVRPRRDHRIHYTRRCHALWRAHICLHRTATYVSRELVP